MWIRLSRNSYGNEFDTRDCMLNTDALEIIAITTKGISAAGPIFNTPITKSIYQVKAWTKGDNGGEYVIADFDSAEKAAKLLNAIIGRMAIGAPTFELDPAVAAINETECK